ncbi:MAG: hypothetical protein RBR65_00970 [Aliarcobacter sp.]|jgi:hypothetical protein|nr:hypothetical protein [Aliarcobacter sp.]
MIEENKSEELGVNSLTSENEDNNEQFNNKNDKYKDILEVKDEFTKPKKKSLINKILFTLIGLLLLILSIGIILYYLGLFTPKEENQTIIQENSAAIEIKEQNYKFDIKDINSKKLNEQLSYLTNKNINQDKNEELEKIENEKKIIEEQKIKEEEALKIQEDVLLKEKAAIEEKKIQLENEKIELEAMRQEAILLKEQLESNKIKLETIPVEKLEEVVQEKEEKLEQKILLKKDNSFLKFINVAKIKGSLYKKYLDKVIAINSQVILCRDDKNRIEIFFGPFDDDNSRTQLLNKLIKNNFEEAYEVEFTLEEYNKRCNY